VNADPVERNHKGGGMKPPSGIYCRRRRGIGLYPKPLQISDQPIDRSRVRGIQSVRLRVVADCHPKVTQVGVPRWR
jgi:hypothetical protein